MVLFSTNQGILIFGNSDRKNRFEKPWIL